MKKMLLSVLCGLLFSVASQAQTEYRLPFAMDKFYTSASLSGFDLNWNKSQSWHMNMGAKCGYLFEDDWMVTATLGYDWYKKGNKTLVAGAGLRYYIEENGIFLGAGVNFQHNSSYDDIVPNLELGYAYFLNRTVTIEPAVYYNMSLKDQTEYSGLGVRIGIGIYFE